MDYGNWPKQNAQLLGSGSQETEVAPRKRPLDAEPHAQRNFEDTEFQLASYRPHRMDD
jgi:hypothetical protein